MSSDEALVRRARLGDATAFDTLVATRIDRAAGSGRRCSDPPASRSRAVGAVVRLGDSPSSRAAVARLPWTSRDDPRAQRLHPPPRPHRVQPARRSRADHRAGRYGSTARHGFDGDHRPRRPLRRGRLLPGGAVQGDQADHRRRDLRRPPVDDRQGGQGRRPALPPDPPRPGPGRLPEPVPARHGRPHRRLLLQAADRPRAPGALQRGPDRAVVVPQRRDPQGARGRGLGARPEPRRRVRRHLRQGPLLSRAPGPRDAGPASPQRAAAPARARRPGCRWS